MKTEHTHKSWLDATDDGSAVEELLAAIESAPPAADRPLVHFQNSDIHR